MQGGESLLSLEYSTTCGSDDVTGLISLILGEVWGVATIRKKIKNKKVNSQFAIKLTKFERL